MDSDETIRIGTNGPADRRIAYDRRPPAFRRAQQAAGEHAQVQPHHQRVRLNWDHLPVVQEHTTKENQQ